jgi:hypothetical protein
MTAVYHRHAKVAHEVRIMPETAYTDISASGQSRQHNGNVINSMSLSPTSSDASKWPC